MYRRFTEKVKHGNRRVQKSLAPLFIMVVQEEKIATHGKIHRRYISFRVCHFPNKVGERGTGRGSGLVSQ